MPRPFRRLSLDQFRAEIVDFAAARPDTISGVHLHHTWRPDHSQWKGLASVESMWRHHTATNGWRDIAQHVTVDPDGFVWTGRSWHEAPVSATGWNGSLSSHPFMIELAGDFDLGRDRFAGPQRNSALGVIEAVQRAYALPPESLRFHNQMSRKTCPGSSIEYGALVEELRSRRAASTRSEDGLSGHLLHLVEGRLDTRGARSLAAIFDQRLPSWVEEQGGRPCRVLLYAHGGLVDEKSALSYARTHAGWWKVNGVYPIFLVWHTGLLETLGTVLRDGRQKASRGFWEGSLDLITERLVRSFGGPEIWAAMKRSARQASKTDGGGGWHLAQRLASFGNAGGCTVHTAAHSAGSILMAHLMPAALRCGLASFGTAHMIAPALRTDEFESLVSPALGRGIGHLTVHALTRQRERADRISRMYGKSLLYLVSHALEREFNVPLLGLEESMRGDLRLAARLGLAGLRSPHARVRFHDSSSHSRLDDEAVVLNSIARRILEGRLDCPYQEQNGNRDQDPESEQHPAEEEPIAA